MKPKTGVKRTHASEEIMRDRPFVMIECIERIPCDPCKEACPHAAIIKTSLTEPPIVDWTKCTGCGICVAKCPGLAIFLVDFSAGGNKATVTVPYELSPDFRVGDEVNVLDAQGKPIGLGSVVEYKRLKDKTALVKLAVDRKIATKVRHMRRN